MSRANVDAVGTTFLHAENIEHRNISKLQLNNLQKNDQLSKISLGLARTMTYRGIKPTVRKVIRTYKTGKTLPPKMMKQIERRLERKPGLEKWFVTIEPQPQTG